MTQENNTVDTSAEVETVQAELQVDASVEETTADTQEEATQEIPNNVIDLAAMMQQQQTQIHRPVNPMVLVYTQKAIGALGYVEGINQNTLETASQLNKSLDTDAFFCPLPVARQDGFYQVCSYEIVLKRVDGKFKALAFVHHREDGDSLNVGVLGSISINTTSTFDNGCVSIDDTIRRTVMAGRQVALYVDPEKSEGNVDGDFFVSEHIPGKVILIKDETADITDRKLAFVNVLVVSPGMDLNYSENISSNPEVELLGFVELETLEAMEDAADATARFVLKLIREQEAEITQAADGLDAQIKAHKEAANQPAMEQVTGEPLPWEDAPADAVNDPVDTAEVVQQTTAE